MKQHSKKYSNSLKLSLIALTAFASAQVIAGNSNCKASYLAADGSYYSQKQTDQIDIIHHAEPDLPPVVLEQKEKKKPKSNTSFFSWLTKSHTMPSLHFIEFIELFGDDDET